MYSFLLKSMEYVDFNRQKSSEEWTPLVSLCLSVYSPVVWQLFAVFLRVCVGFFSSFYFRIFFPLSVVVSALSFSLGIGPIFKTAYIVINLMLWWKKQTRKINKTRSLSFLKCGFLGKKKKNGVHKANVVLDAAALLSRGAGRRTQSGPHGGPRERVSGHPSK